jgi:hypothetical protein
LPIAKILFLDADLKHWVLRNSYLSIFRVSLEVCSKYFLINYLFLEGGYIRQGKKVDKTYIHDFEKNLTARVMIFDAA